MEQIKDFSRVAKNIREELENYLRINGLHSLVVGLSGGIDSALTAALAFPVCKKLDIPLFGRSITIESNKNDEIERARLIGNAFTTDFREVNLTEAYHLLRPFVVEDFEKENTDDYAFKIRMGNVKARIRMIYLYDLAAKNRGMVLSTDNYTELLLGFWTLHGDVGDYGMIQNLWKTEVYELAKYIAETECDEDQAIALKSCIDAVPTDGLGITNSDLDQLGAKSYAEVDDILQRYLINNDKDVENHPVIQRHLKSEYKRNNPLNLKREIYTK